MVACTRTSSEDFYNNSLSQVVIDENIAQQSPLAKVAVLSSLSYNKKIAAMVETSLIV